MQKNIIKIVISVALISISFLCFTLPKNVITQKEMQVTETYKVTTIIEDQGLKIFFGYIGLFSLLLAGWQWKKELDFDSLFGISKHPKISPTDPANRNNDVGDAPPEVDTILIDKIVNNVNFEDIDENLHQEKIIEILELMRENPNSITTSAVISSKLGISRQNAERYLFELLKSKLVRKDTYPGSRSSIYSLSVSLENLAIDYFIKTRLKSEEVIKDYRYIKLKSRYEIDALIKTTKTNYIIETKYVSMTSANIISRGFQQLLKIEEEINIEPISLVLLVIGSGNSLKQIDVEKLRFKDNLQTVLINSNDITNSL